MFQMTSQASPESITGHFEHNVLPDFLLCSLSSVVACQVQCYVSHGSSTATGACTQGTQQHISHKSTKQSHFGVSKEDSTSVGYYL